MQEILIGARPYDFTDEATKRKISGISVFIAENGVDGAIGYIGSKVAMSKENFKEVFGDINSFEKLTMKPVKIAYNKRGKPIAFELIQAQGK